MSELEHVKADPWLAPEAAVFHKRTCFSRLLDYADPVPTPSTHQAVFMACESALEVKKSRLTPATGLRDVQCDQCDDDTGLRVQF